MLLSNTLKQQVDLPVWENLRFAPDVSSALSCSCIADNTQLITAWSGIVSSNGSGIISSGEPDVVINTMFNRYLYYMLPSAGHFWRYDTYTDSYVGLSYPPIAPATYSTMRLAETRGTEGNCISSTANTFTFPGYFGKTYKGYTVKIVAGTGAGQRKLITDVSDPTVLDTGVATSIANALGGISITDSTKAWTFNQWVGCQVRIMSGSGVGQVRRVLYNNATVLTLGDSTIYPENVFCNPAIYSPAISSTAGSQSLYTIETSTFTVNTPWAVLPDATSIMRFDSGSIFLISSAAATPYYTIQQYDIATDTWYIRTANTANVAAVGTDGGLEKTTEFSIIWDYGIATSATTTSLTDATQSWGVNSFVGSYVRIWTGTGEGNNVLITSNTATTLNVTSWNVATPDTTSYYVIEGFDAGSYSGTTYTSTTVTDSTKNWPVNRWANYAIRIQYGNGYGASSGAGQVIPIISNTSNTLTLASPFTITPVTGATYTLQPDPDKLYLILGGNAGILILNIADDLAAYGRRSDSGVARNASVQMGYNSPIGIASATHATTTATVVTTLNHNLKVGQTITVKGMSDSNYNITTTIVTVPSTTSFTYTMAGTPAADTVAGAQSVTVLYDSTKAWTVNQWAGYMVYMTTTAVTAATGLATGQALQIASNTATALTFVSGTAPTTGISKYVITPRMAMGAVSMGIATGTQSATQLQDTNVNSTFTGNNVINTTTLTVTSTPAVPLMQGFTVTGTGIQTGTTIVSQLTATGAGAGGVTMGGQGTYQMSLPATSTNTGITITPGWVVNYYAGRKVKCIGSTGQSQETTIASNTINTLTVASWAVATPVTAVTSYVILNQPVRGTGVELNYFYGNSDPITRGKYMLMPRGGGALGFDRININSDWIDLAPMSPQLETLSTGSMYAYDGQDRWYFTKEVTQRMYYIDINTLMIHGAGIYNYTAGAAIIGNRMEIIQTVDGLKYLWLNRHSQQDCFRCLLFY